ncbi:MAG: glycosyltransferase family 4 protein [Ignavibacteriaceae bacterium]
MKICFATYPAVALTGGGPFIKIKETKYNLELLGHKVDFFDMWNPEQKLSDYDIVHLVGANFAVFGLVRTLKDKKINYVVEPVFFSNHSYKFIKNINSLERFTRKIARGIWFDYGIIKDICSWSEIVLPNTNSEAEILSKGLSIPGAKFRVVHNGVSDRFLSGDPGIFQKKYGVKDFILCVGHLGFKRKNGLALVSALKQINHPAVIIGNIDEAGEGKDILSEIKKNQNIILVDALENDDPLLASAYAACDTFVLPSQFETPGIAALEAGLAGAKIVITPFGGTKEYFKDMALYPDIYSVESIKNSIEKSLGKPKDENLKDYIKNNFLWNKIAGDTSEVYAKVVEKIKSK